MKQFVRQLVFIIKCSYSPLQIENKFYQSNRVEGVEMVLEELKAIS
jgi:hypothetical protein